MLECFEEMPDLYTKYLKQWTILTNCDTGFSKPNPTPQETEELATACENFCKVFPKNFTNKSMTRKMDVLSLTIPEIIQDKKSLFLYLKVEERVNAFTKG